MCAKHFTTSGISSSGYGGCAYINGNNGASVYTNKPTITGTVQFGLADSKYGYTLQLPTFKEINLANEHGLLVYINEFFDSYLDSAFHL